MRRKVYVETSVVSYLTARPSRDLVVAAHQQVTAEWWSTQRSRFDLYVSELVLQEASGGDADAAARRLEEIKALRSLPINDDAVELARTLLVERVIHERAFYDALHVAIAADQGMDSC